ncbi:hypothetical protein Cob_v004177 [Colletotrichum orbiculare MAFF 240422]|uniref:Uncharacterized protein n=1 Tax=Colletotrichum orbiculare (strain 104-T / ATCC 96160 / CBS 514.97 / LARS 414 / MAFF 240422) TaxID=1213857 RepID=A0A484FYP2_COLOR|nr:hypothetical protein Cob_v004177 [Colletotrichum orbiculare MAFF 240422]
MAIRRCRSETSGHSEDIGPNPALAILSSSSSLLRLLSPVLPWSRCAGTLAGRDKKLDQTKLFADLAPERRPGHIVLYRASAQTQSSRQIILQATCPVQHQAHPTRAEASELHASSHCAYLYTPASSNMLTILSQEPRVRLAIPSWLRFHISSPPSLTTCRLIQPQPFGFVAPKGA